MSLVILGGCAGAKEQNQCEADIRSGLLNPETAEFFEFKPANVDVFKEGVSNSVWKAHGVARSDRYRFGTQLDEPIDNVVKFATSHNATFYSVRVKATSRIGLTVTSNYVCAVSAECACIDGSE